MEREVENSAAYAPRMSSPTPRPSANRPLPHDRSPADRADGSARIGFADRNARALPPSSPSRRAGLDREASARSTFLALATATVVLVGSSGCLAAASGDGSDTSASARAADRVRDLCIRHEADRRSLERYYSLSGSRAREARFELFAGETLNALDALDDAALDLEDGIDALLLRREVLSERRRARIEHERDVETAKIVPFTEAVAELLYAMRRQEAIEPSATATALEALRARVEESRKAWNGSADCDPVHARRAARRVHELRDTVDEWYAFRAGYDPLFTWWAKTPHAALTKSMNEFEGDLRASGKLERDPNVGDGARTGPILGEPIGREALLVELEAAFVPYTPEELVQIADREMAWCTARMIEASREMGCGDDWKRALERVKQDFVAPGEQPALVAALARDAIAFLEQRELVTVPPVCAETWRMSMLSPAAQRVSPFFLGGEEIQVAFPTDEMTHDEKLMSMRGNNRHFAHATVFHEVVPGHGLQQYYESRWNTHRGEFSTPFWTEGWALYWEMRMWELGYHTTPEDRVGALFWRMHRCARIRFSLAFHLGTMTPESCIDYLVDAVGHERKNAEAEVRRSFTGGYGPLYQCAYMIGGLQILALQREWVGGGKMSERAFHDAVLQGGNMPIEMVRARLSGTKVTRDFRAAWRFYDLDAPK